MRRRDLSAGVACGCGAQVDLPPAPMDATSFIADIPPAFAAADALYRGAPEQVPVVIERAIKSI